MQKKRKIYYILQKTANAVMDIRNKYTNENNVWSEIVSDNDFFQRFVFYTGDIPDDIFKDHCKSDGIRDLSLYEDNERETLLCLGNEYVFTDGRDAWEYASSEEYLAWRNTYTYYNHFIILKWTNEEVKTETGRQICLSCGAVK